MLLQGEGDGALAGIEYDERGGVVVELMPVVQICEQAERSLGRRRQPRGQAAHPEHQVVGRDDEFLGRPVRFAGRPQVRAFDTGVHDGMRSAAARYVHEFRQRIVSVPVQLDRGRAFDAGAAAGYQVAVGDVIPVEIDRTLVSGRQMEARRMAAGQRLKSP